MVQKYKKDDIGNPGYDKRTDKLLDSRSHGEKHSSLGMKKHPSGGLASQAEYHFGYGSEKEENIPKHLRPTWEKEKKKYEHEQDHWGKGK